MCVIRQSIRKDGDYVTETKLLSLRFIITILQITVSKIHKNVYYMPKQNTKTGF